MGLENIQKRRAAHLKNELAEHSTRPKPGLLSFIYPATHHGDNMKSVVKTPSSIPSSNDKDSDEAEPDLDEMEPEVDGPGTSKTTSSSLLAIPGQSASVPLAHKKIMLGLGTKSESQSDRFIKRCAALIIGKVKTEQAPEPGHAGDVVDGGELDGQPSPAPTGKDRLKRAASKFKTLNPKKPEND